MGIRHFVDEKRREPRRKIGAILRRLAVNLDGSSDTKKKPMIIDFSGERGRNRTYNLVIKSRAKRGARSR
jgi:hypothetical protein